jgi:hypothetical protein
VEKSNENQMVLQTTIPIARFVRRGSTPTFFEIG